MAILNSCCCWKTVRAGSFASGIYTLCFYTIEVALSAFHLNTALKEPDLLAFSILILVFAGICVITSVLLLIGLCVDNRRWLIPWIVTVFLSTLLDFALALYLIIDAVMDTFMGTLFLADFIICGLNIYCLLCVISQYQEYLAGRGRPEQGTLRLNAAYPELSPMRPNFGHHLHLSRSVVDAESPSALLIPPQDQETDIQTPDIRSPRTKSEDPVTQDQTEESIHWHNGEARTEVTLP